MKMTQFPSCCGVSIISDLDHFPGSDYGYSLEWGESFSTNRRKKLEKDFDKALHSRLKKAKFSQNRAYALAIYATSQPVYIKKKLEENGFKLQNSQKNPRTPYTLFQYALDLREYKHP